MEHTWSFYKFCKWKHSSNFSSRGYSRITLCVCSSPKALPFSKPTTKAESGVLGRYESGAYLHHIYCFVKNRTLWRHKSYTLMRCARVWNNRWFLIWVFFLYSMYHDFSLYWWMGFLGEHGLLCFLLLFFSFFPSFFSFLFFSFFLNGDLWFPVMLLLGPLSISCPLALF